MAIRSGTGGLKYPLPANTDAAASIAAASAGGSASASAYGANRQFAANKMRVQADLANAAADRDFRARSQMQEQGYRAQQAFYDREHQAGAQLQAQDFRAQQSELDRNFDAYQRMQGQQFQAGEAQKDRDFTTERDKARYEQDQAAFEREVDAGIEGDIRSGKLQLSPKAQAELDALEGGKIDVTRPDYDPQQRAEFEKNYEARKREILRTAGPPKGPTATDAANQGTTYYDPKTGRFEIEMGPGRTPGRVGKDGQFNPIVEDTSKADEAEMNKGLYEDAQKIMKEDVAEGKKPHDFNSAYEEAIRRRGHAGLPTPVQGSKDVEPPPAGWHPPMVVPPADPGLPAKEGLRQPTAPAPGQQAPPAPLPGKSVGPKPTPQPLPETPGSGSGVAPRPLGMGSSVQSRSGSYGAPPADLPSATKVIDFGTYLLPDGRIIRTKGK